MAAAVSTAAIAALVVSVRDLQREVPHLAHAAIVATGSMVGVAPPFVVFGTVGWPPALSAPRRIAARSLSR